MMTQMPNFTFKNQLLAVGLACVCWASQAADTGGTSMSQPSVSQPSVAERLANARDAIKAQNWKKAQSELNTALKSEPKNADVHNLLGYTLRKQAQPNLPKAFEHYKTALQLNPQHKGAHEYIGEAYLMDKKPDEAAKHLATLETLCGNTTCEEYADLAKSIADYRAGSH
jgi:Tfp pilus assembly protein PilF